MNITKDMINKELRLRGSVIRMFFRFKTEKSFRMLQKLVKRFVVGRTSNKIICREVYATKSNGQKLRLCIYSSKTPKENATGVLWIHGGGYAIGAPEQDLGYIERLIQAENCVVVAPAYTLSVDAPYPAALHDCYYALLWLKHNSQKLGVRDDQLFIGGDSAGGGLTAATTIYARDKGKVNLAFQMPLFPMLDDRMITKSSIDNDAPIWNSVRNKVAWKMYLEELSGKNTVPPYAAPARLKDYSNLPPAYTFVGDIEPFYDETLEYFEQLKNAGVKAEVTVYEGCFHAFDLIGGNTKIGKSASDLFIKKFSYAVKHHFAKQP